MLYIPTSVVFDTKMNADFLFVKTAGKLEMLWLYGTCWPAGHVKERVNKNIIWISAINALYFEKAQNDGDQEYKSHTGW